MSVLTKPKVVKIYNQFKAGVDLTDRHTAEYTCQRKTRRWTLALIENFLDLCTHNSYILFTTANPEWQKGSPFRKRKYLEWLSKELAIEHVRQRKSATVGLKADLQTAIQIFVDNYEQLYGQTTKPTAKCTYCDNCENLSICAKCQSASCTKHTKHQTITRCESCKDNPTIKSVKKPVKCVVNFATEVRTEKHPFIAASAYITCAACMNASN